MKTFAELNQESVKRDRARERRRHGGNTHDHDDGPDACPVCGEPYVERIRLQTPETPLPDVVAEQVPDNMDTEWTHYDDGDGHTDVYMHAVETETEADQ